jgi:hypothetical protein
MQKKEHTFPTFSDIDINNDGWVSVDEFFNGVFKVYGDRKHSCGQLFEIMDKDSDGYVTQDEYENTLREVFGIEFEHPAPLVTAVRTPSDLQLKLCGYFHQRKIAYGMRQPEWSETRPHGEKPFAEDEFHWKLVMFCPKQKSPDELPATIRNDYNITKENTMILQLETGEKKINTWFVDVANVDVRGPFGDPERRMTMEANLHDMVPPAEALPMMGFEANPSLTADPLLAKANCRIYSSFYKVPTPQKMDFGVLPLLAEGKLIKDEPGLPGRLDLVNTIECTNKFSYNIEERNIYKVFL